MILIIHFLPLNLFKLLHKIKVNEKSAKIKLKKIYKSIFCQSDIAIKMYIIIFIISDYRSSHENKFSKFTNFMIDLIGTGWMLDFL